jgi:hypothetical protein
LEGPSEVQWCSPCEHESPFVELLYFDQRALANGFGSPLQLFFHWRAWSPHVSAVWSNMPLPKHFLARLRKLPLKLRRPLSGGADGTHASRQKGVGLSFVENRPYVPGDDLRAINWPATARLGSPIVKRYENAKELILWLLLDPSPSMFIGDPVTPLRWALELAGAAMAGTLAGGDKLGLIIPGDKCMPAIRVAPKRGQIAHLRVLESMMELSPRLPSAHDWRGSLGHWTDRGRNQHLWLISNGEGLSGLGALLRPIAARHRVVWFCPANDGNDRSAGWPDGDSPSGVDTQVWDIADDPVVRLGQWLRLGA